MASGQLRLHGERIGWGSDEKVRVHYEISSGKRTALVSATEDSGLSRTVSARFIPRREIYICGICGVARRMRSPGWGWNAISNYEPVWSPDGRRIAFQSDSSQVKQRPVFVRSDPTYPEVERRRFARVGGIIPSLRVGVVDADGGETRWLAIPGRQKAVISGRSRGWAIRTNWWWRS